MLGPEREQQRVLGGRGLQLEIELPAEPLAQRQRPCPVDAASERRMEHELHAAGLVEEAFQDQRLLRRDYPERLSPGLEVLDRLFRAASAQTAFRAQPLDGRLVFA